MSRRWKQNNILFNVDEQKFLGGENGPVLEVVCYITSQLDRQINIIVLSSSLGNGEGVAQWLGCSTNCTFNLHSWTVKLHIQGFNMTHNASRIITMGKPTYNTIVKPIRFLYT